MEHIHICGICKTRYKDLLEKILCEMECMKHLQWKIEGDERSCTICCEDLEVLVTRRKELDDQIQKIENDGPNCKYCVDKCTEAKVE